jgi:hypothetical protein
MEMPEATKRALQVLVEAGATVATVSYNPNTVVGDPEGDAIGQGFAQFYREDTANLVEVVYTK